jgi:iron complex transport system substrate-binding protein
VRELPEIGRLTGAAIPANLEVVIKAKPDFIVDFWHGQSDLCVARRSGATQTGIPYLLIDGHLAWAQVASMRLVGRHPEGSTPAPRRSPTRRPPSCAKRSRPWRRCRRRRPRVYLARQANGLQTGNRGSINTEIIERAGGINVATGGREGGGLFNVSPEQVIAWNPDTVITVDANFFASVSSAPAWSDIAAVKQNRVFLSPDLPYHLDDEPPSLNQLGLQCVAVVYPRNVSTATCGC